MTKRLTQETAVHIAAHVLWKTKSPKLRASAIAELVLDDQFVSAWQERSIDLGDQTRDELAFDIGRHLTNHVRRRRSEQVISGSARSGWHIGPKGYRRKYTTPHSFPEASQHHVALAGEHAVMSELYARGWNAGHLSIYGEADIVALRQGAVRTIQVSTANAALSADEVYKFPRIRRRHGGPTHFHILVLRRKRGANVVNEFLVLENDEVDQLCRIGGDAEGEFSPTIQIEGERRLIGDVDVSHCANAFELLDADRTRTE